MEENKPNAFQQVFSKVQMKVIAAMVGGLLEEALKLRPCWCAAIRQHRRFTIPTNKHQALNKRQSHLNAGS